MNLTHRVDSIVFWSTLFAIFMFGLAVVSIIEHYWFISSDGEGDIIAGGVGIAVEFVMLLLISAYAVPTAIQVAKRRRTPKSLRALYVFMLLPIVFIGVVVGMGSVTLLNVMLFGWPLFITVGCLVPWAAYTLQREVGFLHCNVRCGAGRMPFTPPYRCHRVSRWPRWLLMALKMVLIWPVLSSPSSILNLPNACNSSERILVRPLWKNQNDCNRNNGSPTH